MYALYLINDRPIINFCTRVKNIIPGKLKFYYFQNRLGSEYTMSENSIIGTARTEQELKDEYPEYFI